MSFVFYDTETTGLSTRFDQIVHFAAIKTDHELREVDRFEVRSRLLAHVFPHPEALCVSGIGIHKLLDPLLPSHYEMACELQRRLIHWSPSIFAGYNSIRFDEELLRQTFFQTLHPVYLTSLHGNGRADVMGLVLSAAASSAPGLSVPANEFGQRSFKLSDITRVNSIAHSKVHNAMSDAEAVVELCRRLRSIAPDAWQSFVRFSNKTAVSDFVSGEDAFVLTEFYGGNAYTAPVVLLGPQSGIGTGRLCLALTASTRSLIEASEDELASRLRTKPSPIRRFRVNGAPALAPLYQFDDDAFDMPIEDIEDMAREIKEDVSLCARLIAAYEFGSSARPVSERVEERIYDGFPSPSDVSLMSRFHQASWVERAKFLEIFEDERLRILGERLIYSEAPQALSSAQRDRVISELAARAKSNSAGLLSREGAIAHIGEMRANLPVHHRALLDDYQAYLN